MWVSVVGGNGQDFWSLTLRQVMNTLDGHKDRLAREHDELAWAVWHVAYHTVYAPQKSSEFIRLDRLLHKSPHTSNSQKPSWENDFAAASAWVKSRSKV